MTSSPPKEEGEDAEKQKQIVAADTAYKAGIAAIRANDLELGTVCNVEATN